MKKLDVSQILEDYDGTQLPDGTDKLTLRNCISALCRGFSPAGLTLGEQADCYEVGLKVGPKNTKSIFLDDAQLRALQKLVDADQPKMFPDGRTNPLAQMMIAQQIRKLVSGAESVEDFAASPTPVKATKKRNADVEAQAA